ncbi:hypothetical protein JCM10914A_19070 [Paenibacillus sp. JCM 10914]|uniref:hypothetical protein n=1 Tax=Paenibacillus sp. JCM 10914 TaxID=1236974 RepID=UPI0003CC51EC|nr:hypothetical protein [Paenibacillus sp. JCM 10914]GAE06216.1 hypothetical protein JCM10914_2363 [Paenibacillus sp. JCM 10914]
MSFDDLLMELQGQKAAQEDPSHVSLDKLFNESFMSRHSSFTSFGEFLQKGNFQADTHEDIDKIPDELFDRHVSRETGFKNWKSMLAQAEADYAADK